MNVFKTNNLWLVLTLCGLNLFVMHYSALFTGCVDGEMNITTRDDSEQMKMSQFIFYRYQVKILNAEIQSFFLRFRT